MVLRKKGMKTYITFVISVASIFTIMLQDQASSMDRLAEEKKAVRTHIPSNSQKSFAVNDTDGENPSAIPFTRTGTFSVDENGFIHNNLSQSLKAVPVDNDRTLLFPYPTLLAGLEKAFVPDPFYDSVPTTQITIRGILSAAAPISYNYNLPFSVIDSLGVAHQVTFNFVRVAAPELEWSIAVSSPDAKTIEYPYYNGMKISFDSHGNFDLVTYPKTAEIPVLNIDWNSAAARSTIKVDFGATGSNSKLRVRGNFCDLYPSYSNGNTLGRYVATRIDGKGYIRVNYDNDLFKEYTFGITQVFSQAKELL